MGTTRRLVLKHKELTKKVNNKQNNKDNVKNKF